MVGDVGTIENRGVYQTKIGMPWNVLDRYALRRKIEDFHKILKSGCKVEEASSEPPDRLVNLIAVFCILS